jgi:hypothetical protein
MAVRYMEASNRRNISPTTSTLNMLIEDVDCSALEAPPEDGHFVVAHGPSIDEVGHNLVFNHDNEESVTGLHGLAFVWGSALRSDRAALGDSRVPVIRRAGGRFKSMAFVVRDDGQLLSNAANGYVAGAPLSVFKTAAAFQGSADRLMLIAAKDAAPTAGNHAVVVGRVTRVIKDSQVSGKGEIEFMLYEEPRIEKIG